MNEPLNTTRSPCAPPRQGIRVVESVNTPPIERKNAIRRDSGVGNNVTVNPMGLSEYVRPTYARYYTNLLVCYRFLEKENAKLLLLIRNNRQTFLPPRPIEKLLDEFAFKIATVKDFHQRQTIEEGYKEGRQAFLAKRWKGRYYALLDEMECYFNLINEKSILEKGESYDLKRLNEVIRDLDSIVGPWVIGNDYRETKDVPIEDLGCADLVNENSRTFSEYAANDLVVPLSSVFLVDVLSNHKLCTQSIKEHLDIKPQIVYVLRKEKERRDRLKAQCDYLENELNILKNHYSTACNQLQRLAVTRPDCVCAVAPNAEPPRENQDISVNADDMIGTDCEREMLTKDTKKLNVRVREIESALREEETQLALIMKRLQSVTGTVHAFVRLLQDKPETCRIDLISHNKLLVDQKDCFILDGVYKAETSNSVLFDAFSEYVANCITDGPVTTVTLGQRAEELLFSSTEGLALLEVNYLICCFKSLFEADFYLYAFAIACTNAHMENLVAEHPAAGSIRCDHADPDFMATETACVRIESGDGFVKFLHWLEKHKDKREEAQVGVFLRVVGESTRQEVKVYASWLCFYSLFSPVERDAMADVFHALQKRARPKLAETPFTRVLMKSLVGRSRTIIVLNADFDHGQLRQTLGNLTFANAAVKATTESADQLATRSGARL